MSGIVSIIDEVRGELNLLWREVADVSGVSANTLANWRKGKTSPHLRDLEAVLKALGYELEVVKIHDPKQDAVGRAWENFEGKGAEL